MTIGCCWITKEMKEGTKIEHQQSKVTRELRKRRGVGVMWELAGQQEKGSQDGDGSGEER